MFRRRPAPFDVISEWREMFTREEREHFLGVLALAEVLAADTLEAAHAAARQRLTLQTVCGRPGDQPAEYLPLLRKLLAMKYPDDVAA